MRKIFLVLLLNIFFLSLWAQQDIIYLKGKVIEQIEGEKLPLIGSSVYWSNTTVGTTTDANGNFKLSRLKTNNKLVVSYVGYQSDTISVDNQDFLSITLKNSVDLNEVTITYRKNATEVSLLNPIYTKVVGEKELLKAACCNLSESFETNPSVDVSFTDAVTGTRQIQMLGLAGPNTQITRENMPDIRGLSAVSGLTYIPGTWIESIHLNKGAGSVVNGFESIAGQIDVNLRNPASMDKLYLNVYGNQNGRIELNANIQADVGEKLGMALLLHGMNNSFKDDHNNDNFMDHPVGEQYVLLNRWELYNGKGLHFQFGIKGTYIDKIGGEIDFNPDTDKGTVNAWGMNIHTERYEAWAKLGKVNVKKPWQSVGFQISGAQHNQKSYFGLNMYNASQNTFYSNLLFQSIIKNTNNKIKTGISFQYDDYKEVLNTDNLDRLEYVPGAFVEYSYTYLEKFSAIVGLRGDYHNEYGFFITPRAHLRYSISEKISIRASGGRGLRTANIISENTGLLASSRQFVINGDGSNKPYGLNPEIAWNYGLNLVYKFTMDYRNGYFSFDFYRTDFQNQIIVDLDQNPQQAVFYNLDGKSYSNSFQAQFDYELINRLDVRIAYRWYDVKTTYDGELKEKPLLSNHRAFINLAYETKKHWGFDYTINWQGRKRIPDLSTNPVEYQMAEYSPNFFLMNAQISKSWKQKFDLYAGIENILNYKQKNPILASDQAFSPYFDSSLIWGPVTGRNIYFGLRYKIL
jgi:TonB dependent receptor-like, beta-barrel/CarboxypepD_reg-like domain/TonB-dependent Receptor Plug Domain